MISVVSLDEFRKNLSDIVSRVMYADQTVLVQRHKRTGVIVISEKEYENLKDPRKRFSSKAQWDKLFDLTERIRNKMSEKEQEELEKIVSQEVKAVRSQSKRLYEG